MLPLMQVFEKIPLAYLSRFCISRTKTHKGCKRGHACSLCRVRFENACSLRPLGKAVLLFVKDQGRVLSAAGALAVALNGQDFAIT